MPLRKVIGFEKHLNVRTAQRAAFIIVTLAGAGNNKMRIDLEMSEFTCLSIMLENDDVFFDTISQYFLSKYEMLKPTIT